jgi:U32 family peptidase
MHTSPQNHPRPPELLAPAGDWESLRAAAANGADAVYFGLPQFNARHRAANFGPDELPAIMRFLHERNVKGFVTLNTLIFSDELPAIVDYVRIIAEAGADAVIVQDLGLACLIKRLAPSLPIHASTQMTLTEPRGIAFARRIGVDRVVLARELSLDEIRKITSVVDAPVEVFIHGALCVAYSGQCLTSEALGGRSANRGQCAQACRLPYEMLVDGQHRDLGERAYLLSPQDLAAYDLIDELTAAGVASFKIEGRLKGPPYVAAATQTYRAAIDAAIAAREFQLSKAKQRDLAQTFSRGFTPGFLEGVDHQRLVQGRVPKSRGIRIGAVTGFSKFGAQVRLAEAAEVAEIIKAGDGVVFDVGTPEQQEPGGRVWRVDVVRARREAEGAEVMLSFEAGSIDFAAIPRGCSVWKTDDPALRKRLEQSFAGDRPAKRAPLTITLSGQVGGPLSVTVKESGVDSGREVTVAWAGPLAAARTKPLTEALVVEQFDRLADTPFALERVELNVSGSVMVPKSVLNDLRRQAVVKLLELRQQRHEIVRPHALEEMRAELGAHGAESKLPPALAVLVRTLEQLQAALAWQPADSAPAAMIYCDFEDTRRYREAVSLAREAGRPIGLATLRILKPGEEGFLRPILTAEPDAVLVRNLAALEFMRQELPSAVLIGDFSLNVANELTAGLFMRQGLARLAPSFDLNWEQLAGMVRRSSPDWFEPVIHQHMPMFHMEHCVFAAFMSTGKDFRDCGRPCDRHRVELRDRVGAAFPVVPDTGCRNTVFNAVAQSAAEYLSRMRGLGLRRFRVDLLRERREQVGPLLDQYARVLAGEDDGRNTWRQLQALNQLGVTRGTLQLV